MTFREKYDIRPHVVTYLPCQNRTGTTTTITKTTVTTATITTITGIIIERV